MSVKGDQAMALTSYPCSRCNGEGKLWHHANVLGGVCFKCHGKGVQQSKPSAPTVQWAVFFSDHETGAPRHAYNQSARTEAEAIKKARTALLRASQAFRDQFNSKLASACHIAEVYVCPETGKVVKVADA